MKLDPSKRDVLFFEGNCYSENLYNEFEDGNETTYNALRIDAKLIDKSEINLE